MENNDKKPASSRTPWYRMFDVGHGQDSTRPSLKDMNRETKGGLSRNSMDSDASSRASLDEDSAKPGRPSSDLASLRRLRESGFDETGMWTSA